MPDTLKSTTRLKYFSLQSALHWLCDQKLVVLLALRPKFCAAEKVLSTISPDMEHTLQQTYTGP